MDLGCGPGILSAAALLCGARQVVGIEGQPGAARQAAKRATHASEEEAWSPQAWAVVRGVLPEVSLPRVDTVVTNPPFGTQVAGADFLFLECALRVATRAVYSLHKSSTRPAVIAKAASLGAKAQVVAQLEWPLPKTYAHQTEDLVCIQVDLVQSIPAGSEDLDAQWLADPDAAEAAHAGMSEELEQWLVRHGDDLVWRAGPGPALPGGAFTSSDSEPESDATSSEGEAAELAVRDSFADLRRATRRGAKGTAAGVTVRSKGRGDGAGRGRGAGGSSGGRRGGGGGGDAKPGRKSGKRGKR